jgi:hypothetical protein
MKFTAFCIFIILPVVALAGSFRETRNFELSADGVNVLSMHCGAGKLILKGVEGSDAIRVTAEIEASGIKESEFQLLGEKLIELDLRREYSRALLFSNVAKPPFTHADARIHLFVEVPIRMNVRILDGSGEITVSNINGNVEIDDDSGAVRIENIIGTLRIKDTSGDLEIDDIQGAVEIIDGSGSIVVLDVTGDVNIKDTSGGIEVNDVGGSVTVSDGSGSIDIVKVAKNVFIQEAGSGEIDVEGVRGKVTIRE